MWQAYAAAGATTSMGSSATAYDGWNLSSGKHYDMNPPHGAAVWLGKRYDGNMNGDVFIAGARDGDHAATDQPVYGQTGVTTIRDRMNLCGREYLGWTDHVLDCPIKTGSSGGGGGDDDMGVNNFTKKLGLDTAGTQTIRNGQAEFLLLEKTPHTNTKLVTGPNKHLTATFTVAFEDLLMPHLDEDGNLVIPECVQVEPFVSTRRSDGGFSDASLSRQEVHASPGLTRWKIPIDCHLANDDTYLRVKVYAPAGLGDVKVTGASIRGAEFT